MSKKKPDPRILTWAAHNEFVALPDGDFAAYEAWVERHPLGGTPLALTHNMGKALRKKIDALSDRVAQLEAQLSEQQPSVTYCGVFHNESTYSRGAAVTRKGGLWLCLKDGVTAIPGHDASSWKLIVKSGTLGAASDAA